MIAVITAIVSGALMSIQGVFNEGVTKQTSIWLSAAFVQLTAFVFCASAWLLTGHESNISALFKIDNKYMLLGGVIGALITYTVIKSIGALGPGQGILIIVTSQLLVAYLIELFGVFGVEKVGFQWQKLVGIIISIGGIILFKWDK
ncbi:MAG: DMT family transporter [Clostridia bacterium]|nr:DMT family transporter [Clostridia bacterium]